MSAARRLAAVLLPAALATSSCAPLNTNSTYSSADIGRTAQISTGTIMSMRGVVVQAPQSGVGTFGGAALGGVAGSFIGRNDVAGNILGAIGGALIGGFVGTAAEGSLAQGQAVEFIIQEDNAPQPISVVQSNEDNFRPGERILLTRGSRTRISHAGV